jgi:hypothetical protein
MDFVEESKKYRTAEARMAFLEGVDLALWAYAWWKDGEQFVGSCGTKYYPIKKAITYEMERLSKRR